MSYTDPTGYIPDDGNRGEGVGGTSDTDLDGDGIGNTYGGDWNSSSDITTTDDLNSDGDTDTGFWEKVLFWGLIAFDLLNSPFSPGPDTSLAALSGFGIKKLTVTGKRAKKNSRKMRGGDRSDQSLIKDFARQNGVDPKELGRAVERAKKM